MNADTLCRSARQLVALIDAGLLVVNVTDDMTDTGLNAALAVIESFTAAVRGVPTADHSALIDAAPELFSALRAIVLETMLPARASDQRCQLPAGPPARSRAACHCRSRSSPRCREGRSISTATGFNPIHLDDVAGCLNGCSESFAQVAALLHVIKEKAQESDVFTQGSAQPLAR